MCRRHVPDAVHWFSCERRFWHIVPRCNSSFTPRQGDLDVAALDTMLKLLFHSLMSTGSTFLLLLVGLPPNPSSLRVRVWRRLRSLGAVPLKRSAYLLPDTPER